MGLGFYKKDLSPFSSTEAFRSFFDGHLGGIYEDLIYIRNDDPAIYYTNVQLVVEFNEYDDSGEFGTTGWGVKLLYGERRPTEAEWDAVPSGNILDLPDIGSTASADISTFHPVWIRIVCPGNEPANIRENQQLKLRAVKRLVGA